MKYGNTRTEVAGQKYASKREQAKHAELLLLEKAGAIAGLTREVPFVLAPGVKIDGEKRKRPAIRYLADFVYSTATGALIVADAKGMQTPVYRLKKHLMKTVHNIDVLEL